MEKKNFSNKIKEEDTALKTKRKDCEKKLKAFYFDDELKKQECWNCLREDLAKEQISYKAVEKEGDDSLREDLRSYLTNWA